MRLVCLSRPFAICSCFVIASSPAFGAGQIIVQYGGGGSPQFVVNGYPADQIPASTCGFRLEQPDGWDGGWHFAVTSPGDVYIDPVFGEISSEEFETPPDGPDPGDAPDLPPFIQMTGPINPDCDDNLYLFSTLAAQSLGTLEAPQGTNYFVADFWDDDDIVWLGGAGEVIPFPEPLGEEPPETPDICEAAPEFCEPHISIRNPARRRRTTPSVQLLQQSLRAGMPTDQRSSRACRRYADRPCRQCRGRTISSFQRNPRKVLRLQTGIEKTAGVAWRS